MPTITITLTDDESAKLTKAAEHERRDREAQASVFISEALGLWHKKPASPHRGSRHTPVATNGAARAER